jgi:hypothetical protein
MWCIFSRGARNSKIHREAPPCGTFENFEVEVTIIKKFDLFLSEWQGVSKASEMYPTPMPPAH